MKIEEDKQRVITDRAVTSLTCDICGASCKSPISGEWEDPSKSDAERYYTNTETTVMLEQRVYWPHTDSGEKVTIEFDICPNCFRNLLIPFFLLHGSKPRIKEIDT